MFIQNNFGLKCSKSKNDPITENTDLVIYPELENDKFIFVTPMTYKAAVYMDSFHCGGQGAQWCIDSSRDISAWDEYTGDGEFFMLALNKKECKDTTITIINAKIKRLIYNTSLNRSNIKETYLDNCDIDSLLYKSEDNNFFIY